MVPNHAKAKSETIVLLFGCLVFLLWLPGLCLNQSQGWLDEAVAKAVRAGLPRSTGAARGSTAPEGGGSPAGGSIRPDPSPTLESENHRSSTGVGDQTDVRLFLPAPRSAPRPDSVVDTLPDPKPDGVATPVHLTATRHQ
jgi:hypothetical protein